MRFYSFVCSFILLCIGVDAFTNQLGTTALTTCMKNSQLSATTFDVLYTPNNNTLTFDIIAKSTISGNIKVKIDVYVYGIKAISKVIDPCSLNLAQLCPLETGNIDVSGNQKLSTSISKDLPGIGYTWPDIDAYVEVFINSTDTGEQLACLKAEITNKRSVDVEAVAWVTGCIAAIALLISAIVSGLSHPNAAAHVATNAVALFTYFQGQAIVGMLGIRYPPIVRSWTQDFQWAMGVIKVDWMQDIFEWYVKSTGGTPSTFLSSSSALTVVLEKRKALPVYREFEDGILGLAKRVVVPARLDNIVKRAITTDDSTNVRILSGIDRVAYSAGIETTELFITTVSFFVILLGIAATGLLLFRGFIHLLAKKGKLGNDKFVEFRQGWRVVLKGVMYRLILIGYPQMTVMCMWELTVRNSAGCVVLAVSIFFTMTALLGFAAFRVIRLARRSMELHKNAAYILFSDPKQLSRWGFLYVQFRATAYWFVIPLLLYILLRGMFTGLAQDSQLTQAITFLILEGGYFGLVCYVKPFMDKRTNIFNIAIVTVNFFNSILMLFFTDVFNLKGIVTAVMGIIFFAVNAIFATILLILIIFSCGYALFAKNPDVRYQRMKDERNSYLKSKINMDSTTELDQLSQSGSKERKEMFGAEDLGSDVISINKKELSALTFPLAAASSSTLVRPNTLSNSPTVPNSPYTTEFDPLFLHGNPQERMSTDTRPRNSDFRDSNSSWGPQPLLKSNSPIPGSLSPVSAARSQPPRRPIPSPSSFGTGSTAYVPPPGSTYGQASDGDASMQVFAPRPLPARAESPFRDHVPSRSDSNSPNPFSPQPASHDPWKVGVGFGR